MKESKVVVSIPGDERSWELMPLETSPCTLACPTRINARGYVSLIADGRFGEALALIRERNPFPGVCGRICPRPCEAACRRGEFDEPIAVCALKRFVFDLEMRSGVDPSLPIRIDRDEAVAVVGAGPAGLSAALDLARAGYAVTVYEAADRPGGMMNLIPAFRLPRRVVRREIEIILGSGIELVTGTTFGRDISWNTLKRRGYRALLIAGGAGGESWTLPARAAGYRHALDLLRAADEDRRGDARGGESSVEDIAGRRIVVIGGGMLACDAARTAVRLGAKGVKLVVGTGRELTPIRSDDLDAAIDEGVTPLFLAIPTRLVRAGRKLASVRCVRLMEGESDATGRTERTIRDGSEFDIPADIVIDASSREIDFTNLADPMHLARTVVDTVAVDGRTMATNLPGIFAAGDAVTGPRTVVEAIASGQKAALGIREYLEGVRPPSIYDVLDEWRSRKGEFSLEDLPTERLPRFTAAPAEPRRRRRDFREVENGYTERIAKLEARRCLRCGPCAECTVCTDICERKDLRLAVGDRTVTVHAERDFWSGATRDAVIEIDGETYGAPAVRTVCRVSPEQCIGCGRCEAVCRYSAARVGTFPGGRFIAAVDEVACKGCGNCVSVCPTGAMDQTNFERERLRGLIGSIERGKTRVVFVCRWARPRSVDLPADTRLVEVMCTGRLTPAMLIDAVGAGCAGVIVCGCDEARCHYGDGRRMGHGVVMQTRRILGLLGYDPRIVTEVSCGPREFNDAIRARISSSRKRRAGR